MTISQEDDFICVLQYYFVPHLQVLIGRGIVSRDGLSFLSQSMFMVRWEARMRTPRADDLYDLYHLYDLDLPGRANRFLICKIWLTLPGGRLVICMIQHMYPGLGLCCACREELEDLDHLSI